VGGTIIIVKGLDRLQDTVGIEGIKKQWDKNE